MSPALAAALDLARALAPLPLDLPPPDGRPRLRRVAMGDPQAPLERVLGVLDHHGLLGPDGRLLPEVQLLSVGDHYDWGGGRNGVTAAADALAAVAWLAHHPPDQVLMLAGNHDLARVGELAALDQPTYEAARAEALEIYGRDSESADAERSFLARYPCFATPEVAARDLSGFSVEQRAQVRALLDAGRLHMGVALDRATVAVHAGVTAFELDAVGLPPSEFDAAAAVAGALDRALAAAWAGANGAPFTIPHLHTPGDAAGGEGGGALYHRPADPRRGAAEEFEGPRRRRFDPRALPAGLTQVIGHVRDGKCRSLMRDWADGEPARDGVLRHLRAAGGRVAYAAGLPPTETEHEARLIFLDAGMQYIPASAYPLWDVPTAR